MLSLYWRLDVYNTPCILTFGQFLVISQEVYREFWLAGLLHLFALINLICRSFLDLVEALQYLNNRHIILLFYELKRIDPAIPFFE